LYRPGVSPKLINEVFGVTKAYCTRVGSGPFPTELHDSVGEEIRKIGSEFGATTGRPRRCGWIDLVALKYACMINGVTQVVMTKADVLDAFEELQVCTAYGIDGATTKEVPFQMSNIQIDPVLQSFKGWNMDTTQLKLASELPATMNTYVDFINNYIGAPVTYVSNGPGREQIVKI